MPKSDTVRLSNDSVLNVEHVQADRGLVLCVLGRDRAAQHDGCNTRHQHGDGKTGRGGPAVFQRLFGRIASDVHTSLLPLSGPIR